jgi:hypothetical protein
MAEASLPAHAETIYGSNERGHRLPIRTDRPVRCGEREPRASLKGGDESSRGASDPTPREILVKGVLMHRRAERNGAYDELIAQWSQALAMLPDRQ